MQSSMRRIREFSWVKVRCPATTGSQFYLQLGVLVDLHFYLFVVTGKAVGVYAILVSIHREIAFRQEGKIDFRLARSPIVHRTHIPVTAALSRDQDIFGDATIEGFSVIP